MSVHLHLMPLGGMAGDMFVAAVLDALPDLAEPVLADVRAVLPEGARVDLLHRQASGLAARGFAVSAPGRDAPVTFADMTACLAAARLADAVRDRAVALLTRLAQAEAEVHGVPLDQVHFHEIADWDTLADLTAAAHLIESPAIAGFSLDPLPLGGGTVETAHGRLPVPAPATAKLLEGLTVVDDGIPGERVTPTGAAIAASLTASARPAGKFGSSGYGAGTRSLDGVANVLVAQVIHPAAGQRSDRVSVIDFDVDDMTGEEIATAADRLRATDGVIDLTLTPRSGKKNRPVTGLRLLTDPALADTVAQAVFAQTSTLGLRRRDEVRTVLQRDAAEHFGRAAKVADRPGGRTLKVEADALAEGATLAARRRMAGFGGSDDSA